MQEGLLTKEQKENETMTITVMEFMLQKLGFLRRERVPETPKRKVSGLTAIENLAKQTERIEQIWQILGGNFYGHITLNNLRMMCLAIKGLHVSPDVEFQENSTNHFQINTVDPTYPESLPLFGLFSAEGDLHLAQSDVERATAHFKLLI